MANGRLTKEDFEPGFLEEIEGVVGPQGEPGPVGPSLNYLWDGTKLGVKREDEVVFTFTELKGEKGDTGETGPQGPPGDNADLPIASETVLGGVKVDGTTITIDVDGKISSSGGLSEGEVETKISTHSNNVDAHGLRKSNIAIGLNSVSTIDQGSAIGISAQATGKNSTSLGRFTTSQGRDSTAIGASANAPNDYELALGSSSMNVKISGSLNVAGSKNFEIPHPHPDKKYTHVIRHGAVESPTTGDTLYRYTIEAKEDNQTVEIQLPDYFKYLNTNVDVWVNPHKHFGRAFGEVLGDKLLVTCEKNGAYKALVIGTRNDDHESVQNWYIKGVEREIGESWNGETHTFEVDEITEVQEITEVF